MTETPAERQLRRAKETESRCRAAVKHCEVLLARAVVAKDAGKIGKAEARLKGAAGRLRQAKHRISQHERTLQAQRNALKRADKLAGALQGAKARWALRPRRRKGSRHMLKKVMVESPYGRLELPDQVSKVIDTIDALHRRHQIDDRQKMAADRYRWAFEACPDSIRCALDQSGRGGGGDRSPTDDQLIAARYLKEADHWLGVTDGLAVRRVVGEGMSLEEAARLTPRPDGRPQSEAGVKIVGSRVRTGLIVLADHWWPVRQVIRAFMAEGAKPGGSISRRGGPIGEESTKGKVAHATRHKIFGFEPEGGQPDAQPQQMRRRKRRR